MSTLRVVARCPSVRHFSAKANAKNAANAKGTGSTKNEAKTIPKSAAPQTGMKESYSFDEVDGDYYSQNARWLPPFKEIQRPDDFRKLLKVKNDGSHIYEAEQKNRLLHDQIIRTTLGSTFYMRLPGNWTRFENKLRKDIFNDHTVQDYSYEGLQKYVLNQMKVLQYDYRKGKAT
eukprot:TRINITY_DN12514_c0_g1::TRINITY_DN12514_c0_g1_i1::g.15097::m.15097 TRINITY_DN12514_c0_g1::TRINITY_DN12514_c0_g1_i1::g.15097  ORF type:complete len:189 (-),score=14.53 TRINITY_DN12514_c0_g1_i1:27-551(-)